MRRLEPGAGSEAAVASSSPPRAPPERTLSMYLVMILVLMGAAPAVCAAVELALDGGADAAWTIARWFVFWSVGLRLLLAGVRQVANPDFTARTIFQVGEPAALSIVRELGFANMSIGVLGVSAIFNRSWVFAAAIAGGLYFGLAGVQHATHSGRNRLQTIAMISDLWLFLVLAACLIAEAVRLVAA
jgi:hypothetical protein